MALADRDPRSPMPPLPPLRCKNCRQSHAEHTQLASYDLASTRTVRVFVCPTAQFVSDPDAFLDGP